MKKYLILLLTVIFVISISFVGISCKEEAVSTEEAVEEAAPAEEEAEPIEERGGELIFSLTQDMDNLDPHTNPLQVFHSILQVAMFEPLVRYDENLEITPVLAESWEVSNETTWTFHIRQGVKFHDGSDLTAEDVKYSLDRVKDPNTGSWLMGNLTNMVKATVVDDYTIDVELDSPVASFLDKVFLISIIPQGSGDSQRSSPNGSGPFKFVEYKANEHLIVEKFSDYRVEGKPLLDKITFIPIPEGSVALAGLEAGDIDLMSMINIDEASAAEEISGVVLTVQEETTIRTFYEVNRTREPLDDPKVFAAILKCLDRDAVGELVYKNFGKATNVPIPSSSYFYKDVPYVYDPEEAKTELEALGYKEGDIKLELISWAGYKDLEDMSVIWQEGLKKAGVDVEIKVLEVNVMLERNKSHDFNLMSNIYAPPPDPDIYYDVIWGQHLADDYKNPRAEELIKEGRSTIDVDKRKEIYGELQELSIDAPDISVWFQAAMAAHKDTVQGLVITPVNEYDLSGVWIE